jgi:hypothetical protein
MTVTSSVPGAARKWLRLFTAPSGKADGNGTTIVAFRTGQDIDALLPGLRRLVGD